MFLAKQSMLKDGSFPPILLQSETMFLFPRYFLGSRRTLDGVVFDEKNSAGNHCALAGERLKH